jgi:hypothetical protein
MTMASKKQTPAPKAKSKSAPVVTPVRNTTLPPKKTASPVAAPKKIAPTFDQISRQAYFFWLSSGGSQDDNWFRAERELRGV